MVGFESLSLFIFTYSPTFSPGRITLFGHGCFKQINLLESTPFKISTRPHFLHFTSTSLSTRIPLKKSLLHSLHRYSWYAAGITEVYIYNMRGWGVCQFVFLPFICKQIRRILRTEYLIFLYHAKKNPI
jgi:hypothetical protein